ncbi:MAG: DUF2029 domain-containing protein [Candidatus Riflebacteria bacterium]|nr:DUF2029 domain-containing protein [Candidatus Riflebacteria bacterium]
MNKTQENDEPTNSGKWKLPFSGKLKIDFFFLFAVIALLNFVIWTVGWLLCGDNFSHPKDWLLFWNTANLTASGDFDKLYPGITPNLPFVYPPYFPFFSYFLSFLTRSHAYIAIVIFSSTMMILALLVLRKISKINRSDFLKFSIISLSSASWLLIPPLGHISSLYLFLICAGLKLRMLQKPRCSGLILSLLMLKPNIGIIFPCLFLLHSELRMLMGWGVGFGSLLLLPFCFSKSLWGNYLAATSKIGSLISIIPPWKHHTLHAFIRSILPLNFQEYVFGAWIICIVPLVFLCFYVWYKCKNSESCFPRLFGIATLTIIVCNPYFHHYDAILVTLPAYIWFTNKEQYHRNGLYRIIGLGFLLAFMIQQVSVLYIQDGLSLVSLPLTIALIADSTDLMTCGVAHH